RQALPRARVGPLGRLLGKKRASGRGVDGGAGGAARPAPGRGGGPGGARAGVVLRARLRVERRAAQAGGRGQLRGGSRFANGLGAAPRAPALLGSPSSRARVAGGEPGRPGALRRALWPGRPGRGRLSQPLRPLGRRWQGAARPARRARRARGRPRPAARARGRLASL
ncbi:hypothetical protein H632_c5585p0, partial [Helicosporidium sp. ATCC 50920]